MGKLGLWPVIRKLVGKAGSFATYVEKFPRQQVLIGTYFRYRRYTGRSKYWPNRGQFFKADRFWTAQSIAWRKKWTDAVKKHGLTGYSLWMKESLYHLVRQVNAPEDPSDSGGYANPPLNPGERLEPCPRPPPDPPSPPPWPPPEPEPEPEPPPYGNCWVCDDNGESTPWWYSGTLEFRFTGWLELWPYEWNLSQWYMNKCGWQEVWYVPDPGVELELQYLHNYIAPPDGYTELWLYWRDDMSVFAAWRRYWTVGVDEICDWLGELELVYCAPMYECGEAWVNDFGYG